MRLLLATFRSAGTRFSRDGCAFLSQAVAFNALFAMFPLVLLAIATLGTIYGNGQAEGRALGLIASVAPALKETVADNLQNAFALRGLSGLIGVITLVWSGKNLFMGLAYALNRALDVPEGRPLVHDILVAIVMLPVVGVLLLVATILPLIITFLARFTHLEGLKDFPEVATYGTAMLLVFGVTAILYTFLPNRRLSFGFAIPGALFTSIAWAVVQVGVAIYTTHTNFLHIYGAVSGILALLLWFYLMSAVFLFGAELSAAWAKLRTPALVADVSGTVTASAKIAAAAAGQIEPAGPTAIATSSTSSPEPAVRSERSA